MVKVFGINWIEDDIVSAKFICNNDFGSMGRIRVDCRNHRVLEPKKLSVYAAQAANAFIEGYDNNNKLSENFSIN